MLSRFAAVDPLFGDLHGFLDISHIAVCKEGKGGVEQDNVAFGTLLLSGEDVTGDLGICLGITAEYRLFGGASEAKDLRIDDPLGDATRLYIGE